MSSFGSGSGSTHPFDDDGYTGYDPQLPSQRFDGDSVKDSPPIFSNQPYVAGDDVFGSQAVPGTQSPPSIYSDGPLLPSAAEMQPEEGFAVLREWRRCNAIELEEKEKREKEKLQQIIEEAEAYKIEFYRKQKVSVEKKKAWNRESEKVFVENQERFHAEAEKNYWKAIAQLVPREVAAIERRGKKEKERDKKKASIVVVMGPKPGKPTDLSRMRQVLVNLSHHPPPHMNPKTAPSPQTKNDAKPNASAAVGTSLAVAAA